MGGRQSVPKKDMEEGKTTSSSEEDGQLAKEQAARARAEGETARFGAGHNKEYPDSAALRQPLSDTLQPITYAFSPSHSEGESTPGGAASPKHSKLIYSGVFDGMSGLSGPVSFDASVAPRMSVARDTYTVVKDPNRRRRSSSGRRRKSATSTPASTSRPASRPSILGRAAESPAGPSAGRPSKGSSPPRKTATAGSVATSPPPPSPSPPTGRATSGSPARRTGVMAGSAPQLQQPERKSSLRRTLDEVAREKEAALAPSTWLRRTQDELARDKESRAAGPSQAQKPSTYLSPRTTGGDSSSSRQRGRSLVKSSASDSSRSRAGEMQVSGATRTKDTAALNPNVSTTSSAPATKATTHMSPRSPRSAYEPGTVWTGVLQSDRSGSTPLRSNNKTLEKIAAAGGGASSRRSASAGRRPQGQLSYHRRQDEFDPSTSNSELEPAQKSSRTTSLLHSRGCALCLAVSIGVLGVAIVITLIVYCCILEDTVDEAKEAMRAGQENQVATGRKFMAARTGNRGDQGNIPVSALQLDPAGDVKQHP
ncbi:unnamed protein product [Amoebophrya sp. A120]|nr:unnamed protein product [Amoebophrya sp. A120]|eukprot:GSA120T00018596001.1